jgi:hypothetical protein
MEHFKLHRRISAREEALRRGWAATSGRPYSAAWRRRLECELEWYRERLSDLAGRVGEPGDGRLEDPPLPPSNVVRVDFIGRRRDE